MRVVYYSRMTDTLETATKTTTRTSEAFTLRDDFIDQFTLSSERPGTISVYRELDSAGEERWRTNLHVKRGLEKFCPPELRDAALRNARSFSSMDDDLKLQLLPERSVSHHTTLVLKDASSDQ